MKSFLAIVLFSLNCYVYAQTTTKPVGGFIQRSARLAGVKGYKNSSISGKVVSHLNYIGNEAEDPGRSPPSIGCRWAKHR